MYRYVLNFPYPLTPFSDKSFLVRWSLKPGFPFLYVFYVVRGRTLPPRGGGEYKPMSFGGKNMKNGRENGGKCYRKRKKGGKEKERRGSNRVK
jgi:hypothetical protein